MDAELTRKFVPARAATARHTQMATWVTPEPFKKKRLALVTTSALARRPLSSRCKLDA